MKDMVQSEWWRGRRPAWAAVLLVFAITLVPLRLSGAQPAEPYRLEAWTAGEVRTVPDSPPYLVHTIELHRAGPALQGPGYLLTWWTPEVAPSAVCVYLPVLGRDW